VSSNPNQRNWRGILIALLVIVIVLALIVTSVVLLTPPDDGPRVKGHRFKLQDILGHEFTPLRFNGSWVSGKYEQFNRRHQAPLVLPPGTLQIQSTLEFERCNTRS
jgi:hypothetical protein